MKPTQNQLNLRVIVLNCLFLYITLFAGNSYAQELEQEIVDEEMVEMKLRFQALDNDINEIERKQSAILDKLSKVDASDNLIRTETSKLKSSLIFGFAVTLVLLLILLVFLLWKLSSQRRKSRKVILEIQAYIGRLERKLDEIGREAEHSKRHFLLTPDWKELQDVVTKIMDDLKETHSSIDTQAQKTNELISQKNVNLKVAHAGSQVTQSRNAQKLRVWLGKMQNLVTKLAKSDMQLNELIILFSTNTKIISDDEVENSKSVLTNKFVSYLGFVDVQNKEHVELAKGLADNLEITLLNPHPNSRYDTELHSANSEEPNSNVAAGRISCVKELGYKTPENLLIKAKVVLSAN